jgi:magnesium transporter
MVSGRRTSRSAQRARRDARDADNGRSASTEQNPEPVFHAALYSYAEPPREVSPGELGKFSVSQQQLLWVHLCDPDDDLLTHVAAALQLPDTAQAFLADDDPSPQLSNFLTFFGVRVIATRLHASSLLFEATPLAIVCGANVIVTRTDRPLACVTELRERQHENREVGSLSSESFAVALLDGHLATYFDAMSRLEEEVEHLEVAILANRQYNCLDLLRKLRQASSRLRRLLAAHRVVFSGLARPDFQPNQDQTVNSHYIALDARFDRAIDMVEHGRDLVVGSFELFTTRAAMSTNQTMQVLTFATVLIGMLAVVAGVLGMNFAASFFEAQQGFWYAVGSMIGIALLALWIGKRRRWF